MHTHCGMKSFFTMQYFTTRYYACTNYFAQEIVIFECKIKHYFKIEIIHVHVNNEL